MLKKITLAAGITYLAFLLQCANHQRKIEPEQAKRIAEYSLKLQSPELHDRYLAAKFLSQFKKEELGREAINEAINVFFKEVEGRKKYNELAGKERLPKELLYMNSEEFMEYFAFLCEIVGRSKDERVLPLLVDYSMNPKILVNFEGRAVRRVINFLKTSPDQTGRHLAALALGYFMEDKKNGYTARGKTRSKIKATLIDSAVSDKVFHVRVGAVIALGNSGDQDLIPVLEKIAISDPHHFEAKALARIDKDVAPGTPITRYPVRWAAQEALKKLREKGKTG